MALSSSTVRLTELTFPFRHRNPFPLLRRHHCRLSFSCSASLSVSDHRRPRDPDPNSNPRTRRYPWDNDSGDGDSDDKGSPSTTTASSTAPWLQRWAPPPETVTKKKPKEQTEKGSDLGRFSGPGGSIDRIVHRLRNLGGEKGMEERTEVGGGGLGDGEEEEVRLGDLLERSWSRPDLYNVSDDDDELSALPWERNDGEVAVVGLDEGVVLRKRKVKAPSLAELTIEDSELRRLRRTGMVLRERITVPKAGVTQAIAEKIHDEWRKSELVRLKFHEDLAHDMKMAHELVERRTGGLVVWRAGSVMVVYRGVNYKRSQDSQESNDRNATMGVLHDGDELFVPDVPGVTDSFTKSDSVVKSPSPDNIEASPINAQNDETMTEEEAEYNCLLDGLGPRFVDWWGTGILPVDADLLPQSIPGYKTPFRLLPTGMRSRLTNAEMTNMRKLARKLPCHFALGRNRNHHGLAAAILQVWEKSLVVKIAVKRGVQNTNNKLMADELKALTGGILLLRNKYYIVIYRGKDFLPTSVAAALAERQELTKNIQDTEEKLRNSITEEVPPTKYIEGHPAAGTLAEFLEAQARWGREISAEEHQEMKEEASRSMVSRLVRRIEHKLSLAEGKKLKAEKLLAKIETSMVPVGPSDDQETITDEERTVFRRIGLRMKAYLPLGIRGVFDGVIENMHLHWKHRELVKLISKQKTLSFVEDTARLLEYESGGILVAIERVPKGYALIYYRGKNYQRPISIRPRNLLTKAKALKRSVAMQRHEALSQHISELERTIEQYKSQLGQSEGVAERNNKGSEEIEFDYDSETSEVESEEEETSFLSEDDDEFEDEEDSDL